MVSLKTKIILVSLMISLLPLILIGTLDINKATKIQSEAIQDSLESIIVEKETALEEYIEDTTFFAESISRSFMTQDYFIEKDDMNKEHLEDMLYNIQEINWGRYHHIFIVDTEGKVIISPNHGTTVKGSPSSHYGADLSQSQWFKDALISTQVTDYYTFSEADHYHQLLLHPIKDKQGVTLAVIGFELMITYEQQILSENLDLGKTGKALLVALDGTPVVHSKSETKEKLVSPGLTQAINTGSWVGHTTNSQGVPVIGFYLKNDEHPWILVAEIEEKEAFKSITELRTYFITGLLITSIIVILLALLIANYIVNPIKKISDAAKSIAEGNFDAEVPAIKTGDEVQELGNSMVLLTGAIKFLHKEKEEQEKKPEIQNKKKK